MGQLHPANMQTLPATLDPKIVAAEKADADARAARLEIIKKADPKKVFKHPFDGITPGNYLYHAGDPQFNLKAVIEQKKSGLVVRFADQTAEELLSKVPSYGVFVAA